MPLSLSIKLGVPTKHRLTPWYKSRTYLLNSIAPTVIHDYAHQRYYESGVGAKDFPFRRIRTTNAMMFDSAGRMVWAPVNMSARSEPGGAGWGLASVTITTVPISCPSGQIVKKLVANNGISLNANDGLGGVASTAIPTNANQTYCLSFYAKAAEVTSVRVREPTMTGHRSVINLTTGVVTLESGSSGLTHMLVTSQNVGDGWWRIICRRTASGTSQGFNIKPGDTTGDGVSGIYVSAFQFEPDDISTPKTPITTTGTAYYGPRFDSNPVTGTAHGVLIEDARTNLVLNSHTYQTGWTLTNCFLSTLTTDPMGLTFGQTILEGAPATTALLSTAFATTASTVYSASVYLKRGNTDWVRFRCVDTTSTNGFQCWVNLATGTMGTANLFGTGTYTASSAKITALPNGWYRVSMNGTIGTDISMRVSTVTAAGDTSTTNIGGGTYQVWGHQVELLNESSYIPTYTASATRAIDSFIMDIPTAINQARGTWYMSIIKSNKSIVSGGRLFGLSDGTVNNMIEIIITATGQTQYKTTMGGIASFVPVTAAGLTNMTETKIGILYSSPTKKAVINGAAVVTEAVTAFPTSGYTKFFIGSSAGASSAHNGWIKEIRYYVEVTASDSQLQTFTA